MSEQARERKRVTAAMLRDRWGITVKSEFVPFGRSRNAGEIKGSGPDGMSLNWRVTVLALAKIDGAWKEGSGRALLTTDYSAGIAHCLSYKQGRFGNSFTIHEAEAIRYECEQGKRAHGGMVIMGGKTIEPDAADVMHSLVMDSDVIDYATYEEWAREVGFEEDSRKGEQVYRACLEIALRLRAGLGETVMAELREAFQDF